MDNEKIDVAQQQADLARLKRDLALTQNQLQDQVNKSNRLQRDNDDLSQKLLVRDKRSGESSVLIDRLSDLRHQLRDVERSRDNALQVVLEHKLTIEDYIETIRKMEESKEVTEFDKLNEELSEVKRQAAEDIETLENQLKEAKFESQSTNADSESILEIEVLRQESDVLSQTLKDRQQELQGSQETCQLLEDELEDVHAQIDDFRRQLEKKEAEIKAANQRVEESVNPVVEMLSIDQTGLGAGMPKILQKGGLLSAVFCKSGVISLAVGAFLVIVLFELMTLSMGKGEFFQVLFSSQETSSEVAAPAKKQAPPVVRSVDISAGKILRE